VPNHAEHTPDVGQDAAAHARMKPATPLPWKVSGTGYVCGPVEGATHVIIDCSLLPGDSAYITHACNAYPKLVTALIFCATGKEGDVIVARKAARGLLRELGEL
jgi:hypothetical protein